MKNTGHPIKDHEFVQSFLTSKDPMSFTILYKKYAPKVYSKCLKLLKEENLAQDAAQDIFMRVFQKLPQFRQDSRFSTWLFAITHNHCRDYLRRKKGKRQAILSDLEPAHNISTEEVNAPSLDYRLTELSEVLNKIPEADKKILLMKFKENKSLKDIALLLNKSEGAIKMKIKRAKAKARRIRSELRFYSDHRQESCFA